MDVCVGGYRGVWLLIAIFDEFLQNPLRNVHQRPIWYENDRKNMANLLNHKLEKMLIFDQKILEFANAP